MKSLNDGGGRPARRRSGYTDAVTAHDFDSPRLRVPRRAVALSIIGFWGVYLFVLTVRSQISGLNHWFYLPPRVAVVVVNMGLSWLLYMALGQVARRSQAARLASAAFLAVPASLAYAACDHYAFQGWQDHLVRGAVAMSGRSGLPVGRIVTDDQMTLGDDLLDMGVNGWFFFFAWAVLHLQLETAGQVRMLERRTARLRASAQTAELRALRYQVNPHFLFNALNALAALVLARRNDAAADMIAKLAAFFRASLTADPERDVTIAEEVALQRRYLAIEAVRFPDRLSVAIDLPEPVAGVLVPALITQPLIENAIRHGVARTRNRANVTISAGATGDDRVRIIVTNELPGNDAAAVTGFGVGLRNVAERLAARYGEGAWLTTRIEDGRFIAVLDLPRTYLQGGGAGAA